MVFPRLKEAGQPVLDLHKELLLQLRLASAQGSLNLYLCFGKLLVILPYQAHGLRLDLQIRLALFLFLMLLKNLFQSLPVFTKHGVAFISCLFHGIHGKMLQFFFCRHRVPPSFFLLQFHSYRLIDIRSDKVLFPGRAVTVRNLNEKGQAAA